MRIEVIKRSRDLTKVEEYLMTQDASIVVIKDVPDSTLISVKAWCIFIDHKEKDGKPEDVELLSVLDDNNQAYSCQSATFKRSFLDIANLMGEDKYSIIKRSGTTKAGRPFVDCSMDTTGIVTGKQIGRAHV